MPSSAGMPNRERPAPAPAVRYREFRVNRTLYVAGLFILLVPWALWFRTVWTFLNFPPQDLAQMHQAVHGLLQNALQTFAQGGNNAAGPDPVVAGLLGLALFANDRWQGGLLYSLEGPLPRRQVLWAKALLGSGVLLCAAILAAAGNVGAAAASGNLALTGPVLLRVLSDLAGQLAIFATALAMGGAMGTALSALAVAVWAVLPSLGQSLMMVLFSAPPSQTLPDGARIVVTGISPPWVAHVSAFLLALSPLTSTQSSDLGLAGDAALFLAWTGFMLWLGLRAWERAPFERLSDGVFFPVLWNFYYLVLALGSALFVITVVTHGTVTGASWLVSYLALTVAGWFFWRAALAKHGRRAAWRAALRRPG